MKKEGKAQKKRKFIIMGKMKRRKNRAKWLKPAGNFIGAAFIAIIASVFIIADRLICALWVTKDLPGIREIYKFRHEWDELARRYAFYLLFLLAWLLYELAKYLIF